MFGLDQESEVELWSSWRQASSRPEVDRGLRALYAELDAAIAAKRPTCWASGRCCKFVEFDHRLYATGLEIAWFLRQVDSSKAQPVSSGSPDGVSLQQFTARSGDCPYYVGGMCQSHAVRPLGCRAFFCQKGTEDWQQDLYEVFLSRLQAFHKEHGLEYRYMDWIVGVEQAGASCVAS
ncbi:MAG: hypothetical protein AAGH99_13400 [Planctomycetota bacterium]